MSGLSITGRGAPGTVGLKLLWDRYIARVATQLKSDRRESRRARRRYPTARPAYMNDACMRREMSRL